VIARRRKDVAKAGVIRREGAMSKRRRPREDMVVGRKSLPRGGDECLELSVDIEGSKHAVREPRSLQYPPLRYCYLHNAAQYGIYTHTIIGLASPPGYEETGFPFGSAVSTAVY